MVDVKKFGRRISYLRRKVHLRQQDVAEKCFVSVQAVSKWERGQCCPDLLILDNLATALGVEIKDLFEEEAEEENKTKDFVNEVKNVQKSKPKI